MDGLKTMNKITPTPKQIDFVISTYEKVHKTKLNLSNPRTFTEKLSWLKLYDSSFLKAFAADKSTVHQFYVKQVGKDIGIKPHAIVNKFDDIRWNNLPNDIILKCNHGSGFNKILHDHKPDTIKAISADFYRWDSINYGELWGELYYSLIPHKIVIEPFIDNLIDTKFFCFNGIPKFYQIDRHFQEHRMNFYYVDGSPVKWLSNVEYPANYDIIDPLPSHLDTMIDYAVKLSKPFKFVRVDFYRHGDDIYGGELTFIPGAANQKYLGDGDAKLGDMLDL